jgi:hypothetical protein
MQAAAAGAGKGSSVCQPVRKPAVAAGLVQCRSRLQQEVREREAAAGVGAIWSATWWGRSGRRRMWMSFGEGERRKREGPAPRPWVWGCEGANVRGKRCDFSLSTLLRFTHGCESWHSKKGTQCQPTKKYTAKCQITHRPDQMDEPDHLK